MPRQFIREIARFEPRSSLIKSIQIFYQGIFRKLPTLFISYVEQLMEYQTKMKKSSLYKTDTAEPNTVRSPIPTSSFFIKSYGLYQFSKVLLLPKTAFSYTSYKNLYHSFWYVYETRFKNIGRNVSELLYPIDDFITWLIGDNCNFRKLFNHS